MMKNSKFLIEILNKTWGSARVIKRILCLNFSLKSKTLNDLDILEIWGSEDFLASNRLREQKSLRSLI